MLSGKKLDTIGYDDLRTLVELAHREDREIDYKRELPDLDGKRSAEAKKELLKDTSAFANAGGKAETIVALASPLTATGVVELAYEQFPSWP